MLVGGVLQGRLLTHRPQAELGNGQLRLGPPELGHERLTTHLASEGMLAQRAQLKPSIGLDPLDQASHLGGEAGIITVGVGQEGDGFAQELGRPRRTPPAR